MNEKQEETINGLARRFRSLDNSNSNRKFDQSQGFRQSKNRYGYNNSTLGGE